MAPEFVLDTATTLAGQVRSGRRLTPASQAPQGTQRLLRQADRDVDRLRDDVRDYVVEQLESVGRVDVSAVADYLVIL
ncbi:hypothetical protein GCM10023319_75180 [Nocardia iowensis]